MEFWNIYNLYGYDEMGEIVEECIKGKNVWEFDLAVLLLVVSTARFGFGYPE